MQNVEIQSMTISFLSFFACIKGHKIVSVGIFLKKNQNPYGVGL